MFFSSIDRLTIGGVSKSNRLVGDWTLGVSLVRTRVGGTVSVLFPPQPFYGSHSKAFRFVQ